MTIKVENEIKIYEENGIDIFKVDSFKLKVLSHWNNSSLIRIQINNQDIYTVSAKDLIAAIENAQNINRF